MLKYIFMMMLGAMFMVEDVDAGCIDTAVKMISSYEGFSATTYVCAAGKKTIGYGFTDSNLVAQAQMSMQEAWHILGSKVKNLAKQIKAELKGISLSANELAALVSFTYNVGFFNFKSSTLFKLLKAGNKKAAAKEFDKWIYAKGKVLNGLVKRRAAEKALFLKA